MLDLNKISVHNVKTFASPDGGGFNCTLNYDGKKIASVFDGGHGGCLEYFWEKGCQHFHVELEAVVDTLPPVPCEWGDGKPLHKDLDWVITEMVQAVEAKKVERRSCKKGLCYQKEGDDNGRFWVTNMPDTPANRESCRKAGAVTFINDKYPDIKAPTHEEILAKFIRNACRKGLCWKENDAQQSIFNMKGVLDTPENRARVMRSYPNAIILNDTYR